MLDFPKINTIDDVLPYVTNYPEILVVDKGKFTVVNYAYVTADTFGDALELEGDDILSEIARHAVAVRRECRGLVFDSETGKLLRRPFHKFFNAGEKPETAIPRLSTLPIAEVATKLDGSMIAPFVIDGEVIWGTRMVADSFHDDVRQFLIDNELLDSYEYYARLYADNGFTLLFEWIAPTNQVVIRYDQPQLVLTSIRCNETGAYDPFEKIKCFRKCPQLSGIPVVQPLTELEGPVDVDAIHGIRSQPLNVGGEGAVIIFENGHRVKVKTEEYLTLHRIHDELSDVRYVVRAAVMGTLDDFLPSVEPTLAARLQEVADITNASLSCAAAEVLQMARLVVHEEMTRKEFALSHAPTYVRQTIFALWDTIQEGSVDGEMIRQQLIDKLIIPSMSTGTRYQELAKMLNLPEAI